MTQVSSKFFSGVGGDQTRVKLREYCIDDNVALLLLDVEIGSCLLKVLSLSLINSVLIVIPDFQALYLIIHLFYSYSLFLLVMCAKTYDTKRRLNVRYISSSLCL